MSRAETHYKQLLARHYTWLYGGLEPNVERAVNLFAEAGLIPGDDDLAVDLGCGSGFQSLALARLGYRVLAIDSSEDLLRELRNESGKLRIQTIHDDLSGCVGHCEVGVSFLHGESHPIGGAELEEEGELPEVAQLGGIWPHQAVDGGGVVEVEFSPTGREVAALVVVVEGVEVWAGGKGGGEE